MTKDGVIEVRWKKFKSTPYQTPLMPHPHFTWGKFFAVFEIYQSKMWGIGSAVKSNWCLFSREVLGPSNI